MLDIGWVFYSVLQLSLDYILAIDAEFTASYERVHEIIEAIKAKDYIELEKYIDMDTRGLSKGVSKAINTIKSF